MNVPQEIVDSVRSATTGEPVPAAKPARAKRTTKKELTAAVKGQGTTPAVPEVAQTPTKLITSAINYANKSMEVFGERFQNASKQLATDLFGLARQCIKDAKGDFKLASAWFADATKSAEKAMQEHDKTVNKLTARRAVKDINPSWNPAKSPLTSAFDKNLPINTLADHSAVRKAITEHRAARQTTGETSETARKLPDILKSALEGFANTIRKDLKEEHAAEVAAFVTSQLVALSRVCKTGKVTETQAREARRQVAMRGGHATA